MPSCGGKKHSGKEIIDLSLALKDVFLFVLTQVQKDITREKDSPRQCRNMEKVPQEEPAVYLGNLLG